MLKNLLLLIFIIPSFCFGQTAYNSPTTGLLSIADCDGILYDAGGPNGDYDNDNNAIINIQGTSGDYLELTFTEFDVENNFDNLFIIQGEDFNNGQVLYTFSGNELPNNGQPIEISGTEVTIVFQSDFTVTGSGFAMEFSCKDNTAPPTVNAAFPSFTCTGAVSFSDLSTGFPNSWAWDFGDGNISTEQNPSHTYSIAGTYSVSLIACNANGCDTLVVTDAINYDPNNFICNNGFNIPTSGSEVSQACSGVLFDSGGPTGDYSSNSYGQFIIDPPGSDNISVTFSEFDLGEMGEHTDVLYVSDAENYNLLATYFGTTLPNGGQMITYDASSILVTFSSNAQSNFNGFTMFWNASGTPDVPVAAFDADSNNTPLGVPVTFSDQSANNPGIWEWDFGDGTSSMEQNPTHTYATSGTFEVTLIATNCNGSDTTENFFVTVQEAPAITINPDSINVTVDAGTITTQTVTICNNGTGDLVVDLNSLGQGAGGAFVFGFVTNENGADFSWAVLDMDFNIIQESQETYAANQTYNEVVYGIGDQNSEFILALYSPDGVQALQEFIWYDSFTGEIIYQGFIATGPSAWYTIPAPIIPSAPNAGGVVDWITIEDTPTTIAPNTCMDYEVTLDATNLNGGLYEGEIIINSNDPNQLNSSIPVVFNVVGIPEIAVNPTTLDFGDIQVGGTNTLTFTIQNSGTDDLVVSGLTSSVPQFIINHADDLTLSPGTSKTIEVTFTPTMTSNYASIMTLVNNAGDDIILTFLGNGIAAPTLTIDPTSFTIELIEGQDSTLVVNLGNIGEADLTYTATSSTDGTGFDFTFTTDAWAGEFSWAIVDSQGNTVDSSDGSNYDVFTTYTEEIIGLLPTETYTLLLFDSFGDGALTNYSISDRVSGQLIIQGDFPQGFGQTLDLGSPTEGSSIVSPGQGTLAIGGTQALNIEISSVGLPTGTYNITVTVATNDPTQPFVDVDITLFVIAPVTTDFSALEFICGNLPTQFTDQSTNVPTSWVWDLGDGTTSTEQNPTHIYASSGTYTVSLIACNSLGCDTLVKTDYVTVDTDCYTQNIPPNHGTETITVCEGNVYDSGGPSGDYLEGSFGSLIIAPPGAESVTINFSEFNFAEHDFLYVYDGDQLTGTLIGTYSGNELEGQTLIASSGVLTLLEVTNHFINASGFAASFTCSSDPIAPIANFSFSGNSVLCSNEPIIFTDLSVGNSTQWFWDFGDGNVSNQQNPLHIYTASGSYDVSLTVCNEAGCDTEIQPIEVTVDPNCVIDQIPVGTFGTLPAIISSCGGTLYDSGGSDGNYVDDNYGIVTIFQSNIGITFTEFNYDLNDFVAVYDGLDINAPVIGFYTGTDLPEGGNTIFATGEGITIVEYTDFQSNASGFVLDYACSGIGLNSNTNNLLVRNDNICDGIREFSTPDTMMVDTWNWNFGDNTTSNEASPIHEFPHNGIFEVSLEACYQGNCTVYTTLVHSNKLTPSIMAPDEAIVGEEVQFEGMTEEATHWNWDFSNGDFSDHNTPTTVFTEEGYYDVQVHLINMNVHETCDANHTHTILVRPDNSTSTEDLEEAKIQVYPNPANEFIQIDFDKAPTTDFEVRMFSLNGQLVKSVINQNQIDLTNLVNGSYYLQVIQDDLAPQQFKILIQR